MSVRRSRRSGIRAVATIVVTGPFQCREAHFSGPLHAQLDRKHDRVVAQLSRTPWVDGGICRVDIATVIDDVAGHDDGANVALHAAAPLGIGRGEGSSWQLVHLLYAAQVLLDVGHAASGSEVRVWRYNESDSGG